LVEHQLPKLRVVGSSPIARFEESPAQAGFCLVHEAVARAAANGLLRNPSRIEALRGLADARVEQVRVALERDQRASVAGDRLDELHVGACRDEARDARVTQVVESAPVGLRRRASCAAA
jgi:hypothetical protein